MTTHSHQCPPAISPPANTSEDALIATPPSRSLDCSTALLSRRSRYPVGGVHWLSSRLSTFFSLLLDCAARGRCGGWGAPQYALSGQVQPTHSSVLIRLPCAQSEYNSPRAAGSGLLSLPQPRRTTAWQTATNNFCFNSLTRRNPCPIRRRPNRPHP